MNSKLIIAAGAAALCCASSVKAAEIPGIPGLHIGMAVKDAKSSFDFEEEKEPDPNVHHTIAPPYFPGYWHGKKHYKVGPFEFQVTIHVNPDSQMVEFISLVEDFKATQQVPDLNQVPAALTEKYGTPMKVLDRPVPGQHEFTYTNHWWTPGVEIECVTWQGGNTSGIIEPSVAVYYTASNFTKGAEKPKSALGQGL